MKCSLCSLINILSEFVVIYFIFCKRIRINENGSFEKIILSIFVLYNNYICQNNSIFKQQTQGIWQGAVAS